MHQKRKQNQNWSSVLTFLNKRNNCIHRKRPSSQKLFIVRWKVILITETICSKMKRISFFATKSYGLLYILISVWVLRTPNTARNMLFQCCLCKKLKKEEKNLIRKKSWHQNDGECFFREKTYFQWVSANKKMWNTPQATFMCKLKNLSFAKFYFKFHTFSFFSFFAQKKHILEYTAPIRRLKYSTMDN